MPDDVEREAYKFAEALIAKAKAVNATLLSLSPHYDDDGKFLRSGKGDRGALKQLRALPPSIANLSDLKHLFLAGTQVTDTTPLANMTAMQTLVLDHTQITDVAPLATMTAMQTLALDRTQIKDIAPLANMTTMQRLFLSGTHVTDIAPLANMTAMQRLDLTGTHVTDTAPLANMTAMQWLGLGGTRVADIAPLTTMTAMQNLDLDYTQVTDIASLVSTGAPWAEDDRDFSTILGHDLPVSDATLQSLLRSNDQGNAPAVLTHLRHLRDAATTPPEQRSDAPKVEERAPADDGQTRLNIKDLTTLSTEDEQEDLKAEIIDALGSMIGHLEGSNQFAALAARAQRYRAMLSRDTAKIGARAVWAIANAVRNAREAHLQAEEDGRLNECLPAAAAGEISTVVEVGGLWLMGHPGVGEAERQAAEYISGPRDAEKIATTEGVVEALESDDALDEPSRDLAHDLIDTAKRGLASGRRATSVAIGLGWNVMTFILRKTWDAGKGAADKIAYIGGVAGGFAVSAGFLIRHEAVARAFVLEHMPTYAPWFEKIIEGLKALL